MKSAIFHAAAALAMAGFAAAQDAPAPTPPKPGPTGAGGMPQVEVEINTPEARKAQEDFRKLKVEEQNKFFQLLNEGQELLAQRRVTEALEKFNGAESLWGLHPNLLNLKGSALVNIRDFEKASGYFDKATALYPDFWQTRFNLAEMNFVRKNWGDSEKQFRELLEREKSLQGSTRRLVDYKIILCMIKQQKFDDAGKMIAQYDIYDDTPIFYYATAALHFEKNQRKEGEEWVNNARAVYAPQLNSIFEDALTELGWLFVF